MRKPQGYSQNVERILLAARQNAGWKVPLLRRSLFLPQYFYCPDTNRPVLRLRLLLSCVFPLLNLEAVGVVVDWGGVGVVLGWLKRPTLILDGAAEKSQ